MSELGDLDHLLLILLKPLVLLVNSPLVLLLSGFQFLVRMMMQRRFGPQIWLLQKKLIPIRTYKNKKKIVQGVNNNLLRGALISSKFDSSMAVG